MGAPFLWLLVVHGAATWAMTGLIWFVQVVHYPLFSAVGAPGFEVYHAGHTWRTTAVVAPIMIVEAACAAALVTGRSAPMAGWVGLALLAVVWGATFALAVPRHTRLGAGLEPALVDQLVTANWIRTVAWSARAVIAGWLLVTSRTP